jgi:CRP/FNR family transcriptional regulator, cyclic AMP receptor protein
MRRGMQRKSIGSEGAQRLAAIHVFQGLTVGERRMLARLVDELSAAPGEELMREGTFGYEVVFVESGSAEVRHGDAAIATVGAGDMVGDLAVLGAAGTRNATVVATAPLRGVVLTSHFMHHVRKQMPALAEQIDRAAAQHQPA